VTQRTYSVTYFQNSYATIAGGNPSGTPTFVSPIRTYESWPLWSFSVVNPTCKVGKSQVVLGEGSPTDYNELVRQRYDGLRTNLLDGGYLTSARCASVFAIPSLRPYFGSLKSAVTLQNPFDGPQTTLSGYDAGLGSDNKDY
jgi:hypothetical protein